MNRKREAVFMGIGILAGLTLSGPAAQAATNSVHIDSAQPYQEEVPAVPSAPTEESVRATLAQFRETYPTGTVFPTPYRSTSGGPYHRGTHCSGWATLCSDAAFGNLPWRRVESPSWGQIRPGDLIRYDNSSNGHIEKSGLHRRTGTRPGDDPQLPGQAAGQ